MPANLPQGVELTELALALLHATLQQQNMAFVNVAFGTVRRKHLRCSELSKNTLPERRTEAVVRSSGPSIIRSERVHGRWKRLRF